MKYAVLVALLVALPACGGDDGGTTVSLTTKDGVRLDAEEFGAGTRGVVLAHAPGSDRSSWRAFGRHLAARGHHVLAIDFRGHGTSGGDARPVQFERDVIAAVDYLAGRGARRTVLVGAAAGGIACLRAATLSDAIGAVATVSAPLEFDGLKAEATLPRLFVPKAFLVAEGDATGMAAATHMLANAAEPRTLLTYPGNAVGPALLADSRAMADLAGFIDRVPA